MVASKVVSRPPAFGREEGRPVARLTNCEKTVLRLMIEGQSPRQMADQLCVSRRTVEYHLGHIYAKLDVNNRMEAIQQALRQGLFQPDDMVASSKRAPVMTKVAPAEHRQE